MPSQTTGSEDLLEAVPDALVGVDKAGVIRFVNHQTESMFGYDRVDLVGARLETLIPGSRDQVHAAHREGDSAAPRTRPIGAFLELTGRRQDGTEFPVDISLSSIKTKDGLLVTAALRDVTDRQKANQDLQRMAAIIEYSDDAIIGKTLDGIITDWNPAAERLYGYSSEEAVGKSIALIAHKDRPDQMAGILAKIGAGQHIDHFETFRVRKDGTVFPVVLTVSPIRDAGGAIVGASTIARDVTKQIQAFDAARGMIESSLDSLVAISPEGKITDANEATVRLTGVPRDKLIGTSFSDYFTEPEKAEEIYQLVFTEGMAVDYPLTMHHRDGTLTEVLYNASVYRDTKGNVLGVFAAARDVTNQMQAQREIAEQQARELERLAELERFQRLTVGRELKMIELKREIEHLKNLGPANGGEPGDQY